MLSHCEISITPAYQFNLGELMRLAPELTDKADRELYRDYMEYGKLREAQNVYDKLKNNWFSTIAAAATKKQEPAGANELALTKKEIFADLGMSPPKSHLSDQQIRNLRTAISKANNELAKKGIDRVYVLKSEDVKQVGQSDNFTWRVRAFKGKLDVAAKADRLTQLDLEKNQVPTLASQGAQTTLTARQTQNDYAQDFIRKYADVLKLQYGVDYEFIDAAKAKEITKDSQNPWSGQNSFFYGGKVYFIEGNLTPDDVLHEYIHPVIKSISKENKPLFNSLFSKLSTTPEGAKIIEQVTISYPHLDTKGDDFKEEVLVRALAKMQDLNSKGLEVPSAFNKFINELLYAIKQWLRSSFGGQKIRVSDLNVNTTLEEFSTILEEGGQFELDPNVITDKDIVAYKNEYQKYAQDIVAEKVDAKQLEDLTNKYFEAVKQYLVNARNQSNLGELADVLYNPFKTGELELMNKNLKNYQTKILEETKVLEDEVELTRQRAVAVVNSLGNLDNMVEKIYQGLKELVKDIDNQDNIQRVQYYQGVLNFWGQFAKDARRTLENNGVEVPMVKNLTDNIDRANDVVEEFYQKASKEAIWGLLQNTAKSIDQKWESRIKDLKAKNAPAEEIERAIKQSKEEKFTPELIEKALNGNLKDIGWAHAHLEAASYSPDPLVGGLALLVKRAMAQYEVTAQAMFNDAATTLKPLLDKVGYNPNKPGEIGEKLGFKDKVGFVNQETGEFEEKQVWRYLDKFQGHELAQDKFHYDIKKAGEKYHETRSDQDKQALANIQAEYKQFLRDYFNQPYDEKFYNAYDLLKQDDIGNQARMLMEDLYDELNLLSGEMYRASAEDVLKIADDIEIKRREIKQLSSLYDVLGNEKTGIDLDIAKRIQEFNEAVKDMYDSVEIPGAFETAYQAYEQKLKDEGKSQSEQEIAMTKWLEKNTRVAITDEYWNDQDKIYEAINAIMSTIPQNAELQKEIEEGYKELRSLARANRDESGQPLGNEMTPEKQQRIKIAQERIDNARAELNKVSGLSKAEQDQINAILVKNTIPGYKLSKQELLILNGLFAKQNSLRLDKVQRSELDSLFAELDELRIKEPTEDYVIAVNSLLEDMGFEGLDIIGSAFIDKHNANLLSNDSIARRLMAESDDFEEWFLRNHTMKEGVDWETQTPKITWVRTYAWNVSKPLDPKYYKHTEIKNLAGETIKLPVLPSLKYFKRLVKEEFKNQKVVGQTVDNRGYYLPKTMAQGAKDDRFVNKEYERVKRDDKDIFALLEATKKIHLANQEGLDNKAKLYLDFPRYRKQFAERVLSSNPLERLVERFKDFFKKVKDQFDHGFNWDTSQQLVKLDLFDLAMPGIPIAGLSDLDIDEVSTDVIFTTMKYGLAAARNKELTKIAPIARMVQNVVSNEKNYPVKEKMLGNRTLIFPNRKKDRYVRKAAIDNFIDKTFNGEVNKGWGSDSAIAQNLSNAIFKSASGAFLNLNIPSAIKNSIGMKFQGTLEAIAGRYMSLTDLASAETWATEVTMKISSEIYKQGPKSLDIQLVELFDPERDRFFRHYGESLTRTVTKDYSYSVLQRMTDFRKWVQLQASLQTFAGLMKHIKIKTDDGRIINYLDAWEMKDDQIQLKPGIDPAWGITMKDGKQVLGEKFIDERNKIHRIIENLNGAVSSETRPEADRYLLFRYVSFFRRFLTSMLMNRFSKNRADYQLGDFKQGFYLTTVKLLYDTFRSLGKNIPYMSPTEKQAALRFTTEVGMVMLLKYVVLATILGFDDDDEDRYKKLRANSDALPFLGVYDDPAREFQMLGWLKNHATLQTMQVAQENNQFLPFPGWGLTNYKDFFNIKSMAFGPTVNTMFDIINDSYNIATTNEKARYKRDAGAYLYNQEGNLKLWNHVGKAFGLTSSTIDPAQAIRNFQSIQSR